MKPQVRSKVWRIVRLRPPLRRSDQQDIPEVEFRRLRRLQIQGRFSWARVEWRESAVMGFTLTSLLAMSLAVNIWMAIEDPILVLGATDEPGTTSYLSGAHVGKLVLTWLLAFMLLFSSIGAMGMVVEKFKPSKAEEASLTLSLYLVPSVIVLLLLEASLVFVDAKLVRLFLVPCVLIWIAMLMAILLMSTVYRATFSDYLRANYDVVLVNALVAAKRELAAVEDFWRPESRWRFNRYLQSACECVRTSRRAVRLKSYKPTESLQRLEATFYTMQGWTLTPRSDTAEYMQSIINQILTKLARDDWHRASLVVPDVVAVQARRSRRQLVIQGAIGILPLAALIAVHVAMPGALPAGVTGYLYLVAGAWAAVTALAIFDPHSSAERLNMAGQVVGLVSRRR